MNEMKTGYDWCLGANYRILDLSDWDTNEAFYEESYYTERITSEEFLRRISLCRIKVNSRPRKTELYLEYRMYGLVPYNISPIQQAIQYGHAVVEYGQMVKEGNKVDPVYDKWANKDKTFIILNGGTTNINIDRLGSLNQHYHTISDMNIQVAAFYEPDLGDQLTAVVFLVDERIYDRVAYPDFVGTPYPWPSHKKPSQPQWDKWELENSKNYESWVEKIGGERNAWLREYLRPLRLA